MLPFVAGLQGVDVFLAIFLKAAQLEVPCMLIFRGEPKEIDKMKKLVHPWPICAKQKMVSDTGAENEPPNKLMKIDSPAVEVDKIILKDSTASTRWLSYNFNFATVQKYDRSELGTQILRTFVLWLLGRASLFSRRFCPIKN